MKKIKTKSNLASELKSELPKSKIYLLINENDYLIKNLKKPGGSFKTS